MDVLVEQLDLHGDVPFLRLLQHPGKARPILWVPLIQIAFAIFERNERQELVACGKTPVHRAADVVRADFRHLVQMFDQIRKMFDQIRKLKQIVGF